MSLLIALFTLGVAVFLLNLFFQLSKAEKGMQGAVAQLEKFMVLRYNLKKDDEKGQGLKEGQEGSSPTA